MWDWRRLIYFIADNDVETSQAELERLLTDILATVTVHPSQDIKVMKQWSDDFRHSLRSVFLKKAMEFDPASSDPAIVEKHVRYLQLGLKAHDGSRKGGAFENYRALRLGAEWDTKQGTKLGYSTIGNSERIFCDTEDSARKGAKLLAKEIDALLVRKPNEGHG